MGRPKKNPSADIVQVEDVTNSSRHRDEKGLLRNIVYKFTDDGLVNWLAMIPEKFIVPKIGFENKEFKELQDNEKLILLGGFKYLAKIRGFTNVGYKALAADNGFVSLACKIDWIPNFETEDVAVSFQSCADAHRGSTDEMFSNFLTTIAENRSFSRCVRNFLGINVLGKEEMQGGFQGNIESKETNQAAKSSVNVNGLLTELMAEEGISLKRLKVTMASYGVTEAELWESIDDISKPAALECIERIKNRQKEKSVAPATEPAPLPTE